MHPIVEISKTLTRYPNMSEKAAAAMYGMAGLAIFPVWWVCPTIPVLPNSPTRMDCACPVGRSCDSPGKHPLTRNGVSGASSDRDTIAAWWQRWPHANIGLPAGANDLAILDVDPRHNGNQSLSKLDAWVDRTTGEVITATITAATAGGGLHYYYAAPPGGITSRANAFGPSGTGLDTRGRGGYVVAPPSRGLTGQYAFIESTGELALWPLALDRATTVAYPERPVTPYTPGAGGRPAGWAGAVLMRNAEQIAALTEGNRSVQTNRLAYKVGQVVGAGLLTYEQAYEELLAAALSTQLSEREAHRDVSRGLTAGAKTPRGPAASTALPAGTVRA